MSKKWALLTNGTKRFATENSKKNKAERKWLKWGSGKRIELSTKNYGYHGSPVSW